MTTTNNNSENLENWLTDLVNTPQKSLKDIQLENLNETYKTNHKTLPTKKCDRCNGHGHIAQYVYKSNGVCFKCKGSGKKH